VTPLLEILLLKCVMHLSKRTQYRAILGKNLVNLRSRPAKPDSQALALPKNQRPRRLDTPADQQLRPKYGARFALPGQTTHLLVLTPEIVIESSARERAPVSAATNRTIPTPGTTPAAVFST
jgi:hypothetical protein